MQEDIFDVVDEGDQVTGQARRSAVHAGGLRHRAVQILVFNRAGELFVQKRSQLKDSWPGAWDASCTGHVDSGETYLIAAHRELLEELGWEPETPLEHLFKLAPSTATGNEFIEVYQTVGEGPFQLEPEEIESGEWVEPDELWRRIEREPRQFSSAFRIVLERLRVTQLSSDG